MFVTNSYCSCYFIVIDENECKYRPCDVFAHCTNTLGSFTCTCFPGYRGDGLHCEGKYKQNAIFSSKTYFKAIYYNKMIWKSDLCSSWREILCFVTLKLYWIVISFYNSSQIRLRFPGSQQFPTICFPCLFTHRNY